jgi:alpha-L-rhamnosidase
MTIRLRALLLATGLFATSLCAQSPSAGDLTCEHRINPVGIGVAQPQMSWKIKSGAHGVLQTAFEVRVATATDFSKKSLYWDSGKIQSAGSVLQEYNGPALKSRQRYFWQVKVWDNKGQESAWSPVAYWETGLLSPSEWVAKWIEVAGDTNRYAPALMVRTGFNLRKKVASARAYVTSHGFYELHLNGKKVGDDLLTPGWTSYRTRLQYQVYDVTDMLQSGENAAGAILGDGWYRGSLAWGNNWAIYGKRLGLLCQIHIRFTDGTETVITTSEKWKANQDGPIRMDDIYNGETYDARKILTGWDEKGYDDRNWQSVQTGNYNLDNLTASVSVPVRRNQEIKPVRIFRTPKGLLVADFGQNMVGWVRLRVNGPSGTQVTIRHAEVLDKTGEFYTENMRAAKTTAAYILKGGGVETYEPRFTFFGFRYVAVEGFPGELTADNLTGIVVHSDMERTGQFECSDQRLNQLQHNIQWGQKGNFVDVPTDCPQRDERLGWTGDAQVFSRTAAFNMNVAPFFSKWLRDVAADQRPGGDVPVVIPDVLNKQGSATAAVSTGWSDVAVIIPWNMYQAYGDKRLLETQYPSMKAWVEYMHGKAGNTNLWKNGSMFGDWLFYLPPPHEASEPDGHTNRDFLCTAFYAHACDLLSKSAAVLGKKSDEVFYKDLFEKIKKAFLLEYVTPSGRTASDSQTSYVLALTFGLLPEELQPKAAGYLVSDIKSRHNHLSTGFLGTPYLCHALSENGYSDVAYDLLFQDTYPSWLYPVKMGATTIWERWDGMKPDSTFQSKGMNSFNHYAYGAIGDWMYRVVAGLEMGAAGYKEILIQPHLTSKLQYAKAGLESEYGPINSGWERNAGKITVHASIPPNTKATVLLPGAARETVLLNGKPISGNPELQNVQTTKNGVKLEVGSGIYGFEYPEPIEEKKK